MTYSTAPTICYIVVLFFLKPNICFVSKLMRKLEFVSLIKANIFLDNKALSSLTSQWRPLSSPRWLQWHRWNQCKWWNTGWSQNNSNRRDKSWYFFFDWRIKPPITWWRCCWFCNDVVRSQEYCIRYDIMRWGLSTWYCYQMRPRYCFGKSDAFAIRICIPNLILFW